MKTLGLCLTVLASSGCVLSRGLVLPEARPVLAAPEVTARWAVTEIFVRGHPAQTVEGEQRVYGPLEAQLSTRLRETLEAQASLGYAATHATYGVEVLVDVREQQALNAWLGLGIGLETTVLLSGAGVGMVLGGPPGSLLGLLAATPVAIVAALAPPARTELGDLQAQLVLRRMSDGAVVGSRHVRNGWQSNLNGYARADQLAHEAGAAVPALELRVLETLREMLNAAPGERQPGAEAQGFAGKLWASDAPVPASQARTEVVPPSVRK